MIKSVKIENYKSIQSLEVDVGRFNVIIGENGAGKSNFLEALVLFGAAEANKLDNEFLVSRGVRAVDYTRMLSSFNNQIIQIIINIKTKSISTTYQIQESSNPFQTFDTICSISILNQDAKNQIVSQMDQR